MADADKVEALKVDAIMRIASSLSEIKTVLESIDKAIRQEMEPVKKELKLGEDGND